VRAAIGRLTWLAALAMAPVACDMNKPLSPTRPTAEKSPATFVRSTQPLVEHVVAPTMTDPAIDLALDDHYAWLDTTVTLNHQLFVYLSGSGGVPANALLIQQEAARAGYHSIGLNYVSEYSLAQLCNNDPDPNTCFESTHYEIVYGIDRSPLVDVNVPNSIVNRLTKFLQYLAGTYPDEGWSDFLSGDAPKWSRIALGGISQGGGNSAMIAKYHIVARVALFSAVTDRLGAVDCSATASWPATHVTPSDRYWGLAHVQDPNYGQICGSWSTLGMTAFGPAATVETSAPPYGGTHMLITDLQPQRGGYKEAHTSTVIDFYTPLNKDGSPALADAWRYMLSAPVKAN